MAWLSVVVEGLDDQAAARRLCQIAEHNISATYIVGGKSNLDRRLFGYNAAGVFSSWFVPRDLDRDATCAPELLTTLLKRVSPGMNLRIPVHSLEAWLMADDDSIANYLGVSRRSLPRDVESIENPKRVLVSFWTTSFNPRARMGRDAPTMQV